jgi:hypothetical protein
MVVFLIGVTAALGFVALGLGLLVLSVPTTSAPVGSTSRDSPTVHPRGGNI